MGSGESILVVDDMEEQRELATVMLRKLNYNVSSVSSGEEALTYLKEHKADLIVMDMIMDPGMDGLETYRSILGINPKQKAIIVSGFSESDRVHAAQALGAGPYVRKPYTKENLGLAVKNELKRTARARILIIDDDDQFRSLVRKMLEEGGYNDIEETGKGIVGMKLFREHPFDLVITDIIMPDKEGLEMITELIKDYPLIKIIAMSGGGYIGPKSYLEMAEMLGASRTLVKPFKQSDLIDAVQELLNETVFGTI